MSAWKCPTCEDTKRVGTMSKDGVGSTMPCPACCKSDPYFAQWNPPSRVIHDVPANVTDLIDEVVATGTEIDDGIWVDDATLALLTSERADGGER